MKLIVSSLLFLTYAIQSWSQNKIAVSHSCAKQEMVLRVNQNNFDSIQWFLGSKQITRSTKLNTLRHTFQQAGNYTIKIKVYQNGNFNQYDQLLTVKQVPKINLKQDQAICEGKLDLHAVIAADASVFKPQNALPFNEFIAQNSVISSKGTCAGQQIVYDLSVLNQAEANIPNKLVDIYEDNILNRKAGPDIYEDNILNLYQRQPDIYEDNILNINNIIKDTNIVQVVQNNSRNNYQIVVTLPNDEYFWNISERDIVLTNCKTGLYWVKALKTSKAKTSESTQSQKIIPNIFTPNGDGINDFFEVKGFEKDKLQLKIFDKSGNLILEEENYQNNWNGNSLEDGLYFYTLKSETLNKEYSGTVKISRNLVR
jgi:gliding motility-associated-like protein